MVTSRCSRCQGKKGKTVENSADDEANSDDDEENAEAPKKLSAAWAIELDTEIQCDRKGADICQYGKCWKERIPDTETIVHHPISPRDSSLWLLSLVSQPLPLNIPYSQ